MPSVRSRVSSETPTRLEVRFLGAVEVILDGVRLAAFNSLRLQRFLALIASRKDLQHRSRLAFELWPDSDEHQARTNLRKLLHDLRHALPDIGEFVQIDNETVRWIPLDPGLAARLWCETEGNPLFVIEALRAGISSDGSQAVLTPTMRAVLRARLGQLTDGARRLAEVAAVIGRPFPVGLLVSAMGTDEHELVDHVDELWRHRIIRDQGLTYDFTHDKLRAVALEMVSPARQRQLHRAVAEAIAVEFHNDIDAASPQLPVFCARK